MRKSLLVLSFSFAACAAATALVATASAQAPAANNPVMLAQGSPPAPNAAGRRGPAARGPSRPAPTTAERTARRDGICQETVARTAGRFAELEVRLNLTGAQTGAFTHWRDLRLAAAKTRAAECASRPLPPQMAQGAARGGRGANATPPNPVERLTREETQLQHRLADIQAERPALEALYNGLSAAQRQTLARANGRGPGGRRFGGFGGPRGGMGMGPRGGMGGMGPRGMMGMRGPQGPGMRGPGGPGRNGDQPPPPAQ